MNSTGHTRRDFLKNATAVGAAVFVPGWFPLGRACASEFKTPNERPTVGCIGTGKRYRGVSYMAMQYTQVAALCDVDTRHLGQAKTWVGQIQGSARGVTLHEGYRAILDRDDIDVVTITTPDHWHTKIAIEAMRAGKDVYCEKPLTLTIEEGKQIVKVVKETGRVFQVGTQQRTAFEQRFLKAVALIRAGRIGRVTRVQCAVGEGPTSPPLPVASPPKTVNWERWLGQAPLVDFRSAPSGEKDPHSRGHYTFRWWYEYSGGKMTDWGAHHVDIAQWAIGMDNSGPLWVEGTAEHPVALRDGMPTRDDRYNTASSFLIRAMFPGDVEMVIRSDTDNGILFEGTEGRFFVSREKMSGAPIEELAANPLAEDAITELYGGEIPEWHMGNFLECVKTRRLPISDVYSHHRSLTTCHLANIAIRLGRRINWDAEKEEIVGDPAASTWQAREQRKGYEIDG
jgi:predicted dehydrogenase